MAAPSHDGGPAGERAASASPPTDAPVRRIWRGLLRIPLFYKILIANASIVVVGAVAGTALTAAFVRAEPGRSTLELLGLFAMAGIVLSVLVNAVILKLALSPVEALERTARKVQRGDLSARVPDSPVVDSRLRQLAELFNRMLDSLNASQERLREIAARALNAAEEERKRISRELHDETAQRLAVNLIRLRMIRNETEPTQRDAMLEELKQEITETLEGVRRYAHGLRPPALDELGLVPAVRAFAEAWAEASGILLRMRLEDVDGLLSPEAELAIYRIVQESLSNAARHGSATTVALAIDRGEGDVVTATIEDDGDGFVLDHVLESGRGLGLVGMEERSAYVGGEVHIESAPGRGTHVRAVVPASNAVRAAASGNASGSGATRHR